MHTKALSLYIAILFISRISAQPVINSISPVSGPVGTIVTIQGSGFNINPASNLVNFGGIYIVPNSASATTLTFTVPAGSSPHLPVTVTNNNLTASSSAPFKTSFSGGNAFTGNSFVQGADIAAPTSAQDIAVGDIDRDGKLDLITLNRSLQSFSIYRNASTPADIAFSPRTDFPCNSGNEYPSYVATADIDGDGLWDIITGTDNGNPFDSLSIFRNTTAGGVISFSLARKLPCKHFYSIVITDINADGKPDIIGSGSGSFTSYRNTSAGNITFQQLPDIYNSAAGVIAVADMNSDGKPDVICAQGNAVATYTNNSSISTISFSTINNFNIGNGIFKIAVGDLDGDQKPDLALQSTYNIYAVSNTGTANIISFGTPVTLSINYDQWGIQIADMNGDEKNDLVVALWHNNSMVKVFRNTSSTSLSFATPADYNTGAINMGLVIADFRSTGVPDIAALKPYANSIAVLRNALKDPPTIISFTPVTAGAGTPVTITGSNLGAVTGVTFGGQAAASFIVNSPGNITAIVGSGATGAVMVTSPGGSATRPGFTYTVAPGISAVLPLSAMAGDRIRITGNGFSSTASANIVYFGAAKAFVNNATPNELVVTVPVGATYQPISVSTNGYTVLSPRPFNLTFRDGSINTETFIRKFNDDVGFISSAHLNTLADIDGDGLTDMIVATHGTVLSDIVFYDSFTVYRNTTVNGIVSFARRMTVKTRGSFSSTVTAADLNGDGKLDIAVTNESFNGTYSSVEIFRNTSAPGSISFAASVEDHNVGDYPLQIVVGDIDSDGKPDLAISNGGSAIAVLRNTSSVAAISFAPAQIFPLPNNGALSIQVADMDSDGKPDIIASSDQADSISLLRNTSTIANINFSPGSSIRSGRKTSFITTADMDGDGKQDIAGAAGYYRIGPIDFADSGIVLIRNQSTPGNFSFGSPQGYNSVYPANLLITDFDGDGKPDIATPSVMNGATFCIYRNTSTPGTLEIAQKTDFTFPGYYEPTHISGGDLDGDARPDILFTDHSANKVSVMINQNANDAELCPNGNKLINLNITGSTYRWQVNSGSGYVDLVVNANYGGVYSSTLSLINIPSSWYGNKYRCLVNGNSYSREVVTRFVNRWTGVVNSSWENTANWSCGTLPDSNTDVVITSGTIVLSSNTTVRTLKLEPGVIFTVQSPYTITVLQ